MPVGGISPWTGQVKEGRGWNQQSGLGDVPGSLSPVYQ